MAANISDISNWFDNGVQDGHRFMIVALDGADDEYYAMYVKENGDNVSDAIKTVNSMDRQSVSEVYDLTMDKQKQLDEMLTWNIGVENE